MKRQVLLGALLWTLLISAVHVGLNVGWERFGRSMALWAQEEERGELVVGLLPVT